MRFNIKKGSVALPQSRLRRHKLSNSCKIDHRGPSSTLLPPLTLSYILDLALCGVCRYSTSSFPTKHSFFGIFSSFNTDLPPSAQILSLPRPLPLSLAVPHFIRVHPHTFQTLHPSIRFHQSQSSSLFPSPPPSCWPYCVPVISFALCKP
jgi:hypothetical protein